MATEAFTLRQARAARVIEHLDRAMPEAKIELHYSTPLELLVAVILSAQCTDKRVNLVTPALFARFRTAAAYASASTSELESMIRSCGFFRMKAKNIQAAAQTLVEKYGGDVPTSRDALHALPGVGRKTAGVVAMHLGGDHAFPVDTHVGRLSRRLGFTRHTEPDKVEEDLQKLLPRRLWFKGHQLLVWHGRRTCFARTPACERCVVAADCPKIGVKRKPAPAAARRVRP